jgi:hypothetical protein
MDAPHQHIVSVLPCERFKQWREWNHSLSERNIRLEDRYGMVIGEVMKKVDADTEERTAFINSQGNGKGLFEPEWGAIEAAEIFHR